MTGDELSDGLQIQLLAVMAQKDGAYLERNRCVALIARMAIATGLVAGTARTPIEGWAEDWHGCVFIDLPTGQASWHYHDSQAQLFAALPPYTGAWDGHDTPEKYRRVGDAFAQQQAPSIEWMAGRLVAAAARQGLVLTIEQRALQPLAMGNHATHISTRPMRKKDDMEQGTHDAPQPIAWGSDALRDIATERRRQIEAEGYDPEHDDAHVSDEIAAAACFYAMPPGAREWDASSTGYGRTLGLAIIPEGWTVAEGDRRRELVKAGALIVAEIERLDRAA